jgi:hypothetical protein
MNRKERERMKKKAEDAKRDRILAVMRFTFDRKHTSASTSARFQF